ncbi:response regulator transcription factor [Desulfatirhabdium butyrativorans]|uniref:response regulator transcription factor n=1 Tax=Desulfatirhabdium butyrativorans TaxID=340467 RepID=UPI00042A3F61|nr:response regulator transcription factor [Desulfatirhabdium butyrativorans]
MIRVLIADDHTMVRAGLCRIVEESEEMTVVAEAASGRQAVQLAREHQPDVAVIDISMPEGDGLEVMRQVFSFRPELPVIILTMHEEEQYVIRAIEAGAKGYITKRSAPEQLVSAIRQVMAGGMYLTPEVGNALAQYMSRGKIEKSLLDTISTRELQVLRLLAMGRTNREIASEYNISIKTVDTYRLRLLKKLNLRNNADLSRFAVQNRLID